jgi:hypothetical protein
MPVKRTRRKNKRRKVRRKTYRKKTIGGELKCTLETYRNPGNKRDLIKTKSCRDGNKKFDLIETDEVETYFDESKQKIILKYKTNPESSEAGYEKELPADWYVNYDTEKKKFIYINAKTEETSDSFPGGIWTEYYDNEAQSKYYYNNKTGEATWKKPKPSGLLRTKKMRQLLTKKKIPSIV